MAGGSNRSGRRSWRVTSPLVAVSILTAISGDGCRPVVYAIYEALQTLNPPPAAETADESFEDTTEE